MMRPFVDESIYAAQVINLIFRNGETKDGRRIFNEQDKLGDKITKSMKEVAFALSPGSLPQLKRLYKAVAGEKIKGVQYEIPSEIAGFFGFRGVPLDIPKTLTNIIAFVFFVIFFITSSAFTFNVSGFASINLGISPVWTNGQREVDQQSAGINASSPILNWLPKYSLKEIF